MSKEQFHCGIILENFEPYEFYCPCCNRERMDKQTLLRIQRFRTDYDKPLSVVEGGGWRCENYSSNGKSAHREGKAVDIGYPWDDHFMVVDLAFKHGFTGIGDKNKGGRYQLHMDDADAIPGFRPRPRKWTY